MRGGVANSPPLNVLTACRNLSSVLWKKALLNREASFLFFPAKARIECVCVWGYIFFNALCRDLLSLLTDQRWHLMMEHCKKRKSQVDQRPSTLVYLPFFQLFLESKKTSLMEGNIIPSFFKSCVVVVVPDVLTKELSSSFLDIIFLNWFHLPSFLTASLSVSLSQILSPNN